MGFRSARNVVRNRTLQSTPRLSLSKAVIPVIEALEGRRLFATSTIQSLPFALEFNSDRGELVDMHGEGTGFTRVQTNQFGTGLNASYNASLIDLNTTAGVLKITTSGNSTAGGNYNGDNTLVNGLETQFDATTSGFAITTRLKGPLSFIDNPSEQAGIMFGPDQDNYVKLVAVAQPDGQFIQFIDEQTSGTTYSHALAGSNINNTYTNIGSFASITTLDLRLVGDAATGKVTAFYAVNGGAFVKISAELTLTGSKKDAFFTSAGRAGLIAMHKNDLGAMTATFDRFEITAGSTPGAQPSIVASDPANGQTNVHRDATIRNSVYLPTPGAGVDVSTLTSSTVRLFRTSDGAIVPGSAGTSGGGDVINFAPSVLLAANTNYTFVIDGVKDTSGATFLRYQISFTTGTESTPVNTNYSFEKVTLNTAGGHSYTAVKMGPDGKLYAATLEGLIQRFSINADGTLGAAQNITSLQTAEGGNRFLTGIAFDPASTASNLILWVSHSYYALTNAQDWSGKISKLTGANLATVTHVVKNLPRSIRDHTTNQIAFSPVDGKLYFTQGSMSAMGAPDNAWGLRAEHLLSGAVLRLDPSKIAAGTTLDVKTEDGGTYNPFATNAPLTIYGRGVRNAYDLLFHSNGRLYVPTNGSAPGGNTPAGGGAPALKDVREVMNDYLFDVVAGGYYGHPNPLLGHYVLNGGNPTSGADPGEVVSYPVGTQPDSNYRGFAYDFGENQSPNGVIEYRSGGSAFGGTLDGKILVVRYSVGGGQDVIALTPGAGGAITGVNINIPGLTSFDEPLDIEVNPANGFLYVVEHGGKRITLSRPITAGAKAELDKPKLVFNDPTTSGSQTQEIIVKNTGTGPLVLGTDAFSITGADAGRFSLPNKPTTSITLQPGESLKLNVRFTSDAVRIFNATLVVNTNDPNKPTINVSLRGLGTAGTGGSNEPSLQRMLDLHQIPINVGDADPLTTELQTPLTTPNDELVMPRLQRAGSGPVTIEPLAVFGVGHSTLPTLRFGYYTPGNRVDRTELFTVRGTSDAQTVAPNVTGNLSFDPGAAAFSLYGLWPSMSTISSSFPQGTETYSEDVFNAELDPSSTRKFRFYQLKNPHGTVVPNAYVVAVEEFTGGNYDNQDVVFIIRNVKAAPAGAEIGYENLDGAPYNDRMIFNRISNPDLVNPNYVKDLGKIRIRNTGSSTLTINSLTLSNTAWELVNPPTGSFTLAANGGFRDITIRFKATSGSIHNGTLTISSNDADEPTTVIQLAGWRQNRSENNEEPDLQQQLQVLGYATQVTGPGQTLSNGGKVEAVGDEILSPYWKHADTGAPVSVRQLSAYHTQGETATVRYHTKNSTSTTNLFTHNGLDGQTFFPRISGSLAPAVGSFNHTGTFGFRVDNEWSDPTKNTGSGDPGHHVRFFIAKDRTGNVIPNTYLMVMDYAAINYDYQDNVYLITNIKPELVASAQTPFHGAPFAIGSTPVTIQAEDYDLGGQGVAYNDTDAKNDGNAYRPNDGVDIMSHGARLYRIGGPAAGEWLEYTINVAQAGEYELEFGVSQSASGATFHAEIDGVNVTGALAAPNTGGFSTFTSVKKTVTLTAGQHVLRFAHDTNATNGYAVGLDWIRLTQTAVQPPPSPQQPFQSAPFAVGATPVTIQAEDYDRGGEGIAYHDVDSKNDGGHYRPDDGVDIMSLGSGQYRIGGPKAGEWMEYTIEVAQGGAYELEFRVSQSSAGAIFHAEIDGINVTGALAAPKTGSFSTFTSVKHTVTLSAGTHVLRLAQDANAANGYAVGFDWIKLTQQEVAEPTAPTSPSGLAANGSTSGVQLDWGDNAEPDLAGYNLYRSDALDGTYTLLNTGGLLTASLFDDTSMPAGATRYYRVTAVNTNGQESAQSPAVSGTRTAANAQSPYHGSPFAIGTTPVTIEAEDYDLGGEGIAYHDIDAKNDGGHYRPGDGVDIMSHGPGLYRIGGPNSGEWLEYTVIVQQSGQYTLDCRVANRDAGSTFHLEINGMNVSGIVAAPDTDSFNTFTTVSVPVTLAAGEQVLRFVHDDAAAGGYGAAFDWMKFALQQPPQSASPAVPTGVTAAGSSSGVALDWADNLEPDLAGYNVYRSQILYGTYTLVNTDGLLVASAFDDTSMPAGATRYYKVTAVNTGGEESASSTAVGGTRTADAQQPFHGAPFAVGATPITIQAEDYDLGGEGIAYHDIDAKNDGNAYRPADGVDIMSLGGGQYRIGGPKAGEWMEYTMDVAEGGDYELEFYVSQSDPGATFHAEINGVDVTGTLAAPDTNSFSSFAGVKHTVTLSAGTHVLRLAQDANAANGYAVAFDWIKLTQQQVT